MFQNFIHLDGRKRDIICESHNSVKTRSNSEKNSGHMQFHLLYKMVKKIHGSGESQLPLNLYCTLYSKKNDTISSNTFFILQTVLDVQGKYTKRCSVFRATSLYIVG